MSVNIFFTNGGNTTIVVTIEVSKFFRHILCKLSDEEIENFNTYTEIIIRNTSFIELVWDACDLIDYPREFPNEMRVVMQ